MGAHLVAYIDTLTLELLLLHIYMILNEYSLFADI